MSKTHRASVFGDFFQEVEAKFFAPQAPVNLTMRYEVLIRKVGDHPTNPMIKHGDTFVGKIITTLSLEKWCATEGYSLVVLQSKGPALLNEQTELL